LSSIDFNHSFKDLNIASAVNKFYKLINHFIELFVPKSKIIAQLFAQYFSSVYETSDSLSNVFTNYDADNIISNLNLSSWYISENEIFEALSSMNVLVVRVLTEYHQAF